MDTELVQQVRRFNRTVTQRVGALDDEFLATDRPLGQARLLWEIGMQSGGADVRELRSRLDLDAGYVSRLLRALEDDGLVRMTPSETDGRVRTAKLTERGLDVRVELNHRADAAAASILTPLNPTQRSRLVNAMAEVERLMIASMIELEVTDPRDPRARTSLAAYFAELGERFDAGYDPARDASATDDEMTPPAGLFLMAKLHDQPVGCGALKFHPDEPPDLKRMWVARTVRGLGLGRRLLTELERLAADHGAKSVRLETNRSLTEAITMYQNSGYREVPPFNDVVYAHHWFEKNLYP